MPRDLLAERQRWSADPGSTGTVCVVGLGKIGLPLAAQYADAGWHVVGVDVSQAVVDLVNAGRSHLTEEPGLDEALASAHADGRITATTGHAAAAEAADVVVVIVPLMLSSDGRPDYGALSAATEALGAGLRPGTLVIYETTLPVGATRERFAPMLERASGLTVGAEDGLYLAFSPERVLSGRILRDLATYPKLVGGVDPASARRAEAFYRSVLSAEVRVLASAETAELVKLAETTYRDVNIALANQFATYADRVGVDILEVIRGANSQPHSHIHQPGLGVGGHCIPVYPNFILTDAPDLELIAASRRINDAQVDRAVEAIAARLSGGLADAPVLVLGLTYREGVAELAYSRALPLIDRLREQGAEVWAFDPLLSASDITRLGAHPYAWGEPSEARVIVTQTADQCWHDLTPSLYPRLEVLFDGRNSLPDRLVSGPYTYLGVGRRALSSAGP